MDYSSRNRYRARREALAARRRRLMYAIGAVLLLVVGGGALAWWQVNSSVPNLPISPTAAATANAVLLPTAAAPADASPTASLNVPTAEAVVIPPAPAGAAPYFDDRRLTYEPDFYASQIQAFLDSQAGTLNQMSIPVGDGRYTFAQALVGQTAYYSVNPRVILALLEQRSSLLSNPRPSSDQLGWALGYQGENGNRRGLAAQIRWAVKQILYAKRDYPQYAPLTYADSSSSPAPPGLSLSEYSIARVLAPTTSPDRLPALLASFLQTYTRLFGDPRIAPSDWPRPAVPFLAWPLEHPAAVTSFFDHGGPFLTRNQAAGVTTYWGRTETDIAFAYNGHDGWDYAAAPPDLALAAADGTVVFAGNADDGCATRAVILDHGNGYRTLYWHLARVDATFGQQVARGQSLGVVGESGCAAGPHLHFGVQYLGRNTDPYGWCGTNPDPWEQNPAGDPSIWLWADRPSPCAPPPPAAIVVDTDSPGFAKEGDGWQTVPVGYGGTALFAPSLRGSSAFGPLDLRPLTAPAVAVWRPALPKAGRYRVLAYVPYALSGLEDATQVRYRLRYHGGEAEIMVNIPLHANDWVDLGTYEFDPNETPLVSISNLAEDGQRSVWADAIIWLPVSS